MHCTFICDDDTLQARRRATSIKQRFLPAWKGGESWINIYLLQALIHLGSAALIVPDCGTFGLRIGAGVSDHCGLHYRPLGIILSRRTPNLFPAFCGNRRRADVVCYWLL